MLCQSTRMVRRTVINHLSQLKSSTSMTYSYSTHHQRHLSALPHSIQQRFIASKSQILPLKSLDIKILPGNISPYITKENATIATTTAYSTISTFSTTSKLLSPTCSPEMSINATQIIPPQQKSHANSVRNAPQFYDHNGYLFESGRKYPTLPQNDLYDGTVETFSEDAPIAKFDNRARGSFWGTYYEKLPDEVNRVLVVGDIHGCYDELLEFLDSVDYDPHSDILITLGDTVGKGPKSVQVVDFLINLQRYACEEIDKVDIIHGCSPQLTLSFNSNPQEDTQPLEQNQHLQQSQPLEQNQQLNQEHHKYKYHNQLKPPKPDESILDIGRQAVAPIIRKCYQIFDFYDKDAQLVQNLHHNSRVFNIIGNHEQFVLNYSSWLRRHHNLPEQIPLRSITHCNAAKHFVSYPEKQLENALVGFIKTTSNSGLQEALQQRHPPPPHIPSHQSSRFGTTPKPKREPFEVDVETSATSNTADPFSAISRLDEFPTNTPDVLVDIKHLNHAKELFSWYSNPQQKLANDLRFQWFVTMPQYLSLPQLNLLCTHAGIPPDAIIPSSHNPQQGNPANYLSAYRRVLSHAASVFDEFNRDDILNIRSVKPDRIEHLHTGAESSDQKRQRRSLDLLNKSKSFISKYRICNKPRNQWTMWADEYSDRMQNFTTKAQESSTGAFNITPHVVFGHDALAGLQLRSHATGLDTGCCYGKQLSGLVFPLTPQHPPTPYPNQQSLEIPYDNQHTLIQSHPILIQIQSKQPPLID